jgi:hypothetical protein
VKQPTRESVIIASLEESLVQMKSSDRKADRQYAENLANRRGSGAFERMASLIVLIEDILKARSISLRTVSQSTWTRYYSKEGIFGTVIRLSDHRKDYCPKVAEVTILIDESMTEDEARQAAVQALQEFARIESDDN